MAIDDFLMELGSRLGVGPLRRDAQGVCRLVFDGEYIIDMEPSRDGGDLYLIATVGPLDAVGGAALMKRMLGANLVGNGTNGATLSVDVLTDEVVLWRALHLAGLSYEYFQSSVEGFIAALERWRRELDEGGKTAAALPETAFDDGWRVIRA